MTGQDVSHVALIKVVLSVDEESHWVENTHKKMFLWIKDEREEEGRGWEGGKDYCFKQREREKERKKEWTEGRERHESNSLPS